MHEAPPRGRAFESGDKMVSISGYLSIVDLTTSGTVNSINSDSDTDDDDTDTDTTDWEKPGVRGTSRVVVKSQTASCLRVRTADQRTGMQTPRRDLCWTTRKPVRQRLFLCRRAAHRIGSRRATFGLIELLQSAPSADPSRCLRGCRIRLSPVIGISHPRSSRVQDFLSRINFNLRSVLLGVTLATRHCR